MLYEYFFSDSLFQGINKIHAVPFALMLDRGDRSDPEYILETEFDGQTVKLGIEGRLKLTKNGSLLSSYDFTKECIDCLTVESLATKAIQVEESPHFAWYNGDEKVITGFFYSIHANAQEEVERLAERLS